MKSRINESPAPIPDKKIEAVAVSDGEILKTSLDLCGHSEDDVFNILNSNNIDLDEVFLMTLDGNGSYRIIKKEK